MTNDELLGRTGAIMAAHLDGSRPLLSIVEAMHPDDLYRTIDIT